MARSRPPLLEGSRLAFLVALASAVTCGVLAWRGTWSLWLAVAAHVGLTSLLTYFVFAWDKRKAKGTGRRISEANLLWLTFLGGAPGAYAAMRRLRHKTQTGRFVWLVPVAALLQLVAIAWVAVRGG